MKYELNTVENDKLLMASDLEYGKLYKIVSNGGGDYDDYVVTPSEVPGRFYTLWPKIGIWTGYREGLTSFRFRLLPPGTTVTLTQE